MIGHMRHGSPPRLLALQSILSPNRRESLPTPSAGVRITGYLLADPGAGRRGLPCERGDDFCSIADRAAAELQAPSRHPNTLAFNEAACFINPLNIDGRRAIDRSSKGAPKSKAPHRAHGGGHASRKAVAGRSRHHTAAYGSGDQNATRNPFHGSPRERMNHGARAGFTHQAYVSLKQARSLR